MTVCIWENTRNNDQNRKTMSTQDNNMNIPENILVKDTMARKKVAFKELCRFPSEENETKYKRIRNQTRKIVARAMRMKAN